MAQDPDVTALPAAYTSSSSAEIGKPNMLDPATAYAGGEEPDKQYWSSCLDDAERAEKDWRQRGRQIVQIYRNELRTGVATRLTKVTAPDTGVTFNILYANTEVMLPAIYMKPPQPVVRSRFVVPAPPPPPLMPPMMMGAPPMGPPIGPGGPPPAPGGPPPIQLPPGGPPPPLGGPPPAMPGGPPPAQPVGPVGPPGAPLPAAATAPPVELPPGGLDFPPGGMPGMGQPGLMPPPPPMAPPPPAGHPPQSDIETAASVIEKALEIVVDDEHSHEAVKGAIKDVLLPGRGVCRVRWKPVMKDFPVTAGDGVTPLPNPETGEPQVESRKVWEEVDDEYVYWEDVLFDPVRQAADMGWVAFRHLFDEKALVAEFQGSSPEFDKLIAAGKVSDLLKWTDESAAKDVIGGGAAMKTAKNLGDHVRKAMIWEIWDRRNRRIIWFCRDASGLIMRVDPDTLQLEGFFPIPVPMLAVRTSDSRIPRAYFDLYAKLADDLDRVSLRISKLTDQIKVRGAYNAANRDIADILTAGDNKMVGIEGVDLMSGGLGNHIWIVPIDTWMAALDKLFLAREQMKIAIYEIMGISDIMRGASKASETATAQRIKGSMGVSRLEDAKQQAGNFVRDLLRLKAEIIAKNFDAATLAAMTGEEVTPAVMAILRSDFMRTCSIDIEADSTVAVDEQAEQQGMATIMQAIQGVMQGVQGMLMTGILPPQQVMQLGMELLKMFLHPVRYSRGVVELLNRFQEQLARMPPMPPPPPGGAGGGPPAPGGPRPPMGPPGGGPPGAAPPNKPSRPNGAPPVVAPAGPAAPPIRI